jgi:hypothetical protein
LICTDRRILIIKAGFATGATFGSNIFQLPYSSITGVDVKMNWLSGYFEVSAGGMQNTQKNYWAAGTSASPQRSPNCVSLNKTCNIPGFREACTFILRKSEDAKRAPAAPAEASASADLSALERLGQLRERGVLSEAEFQAKKAEILARL